jgi:hypothetical protein
MKSLIAVAFSAVLCLVFLGCTAQQVSTANSDIASMVKTPDQFLQTACPQIKIATNLAATPGVIPDPKLTGAFMAASLVVDQVCAQSATVPTLQSLSGALPQIQQAVQASNLTADQKQYIALGIALVQSELSAVVQVAPTPVIPVAPVAAPTTL